jgi:hypothetical protein
MENLDSKGTFIILIAAGCLDILFLYWIYKLTGGI